MSYLSLHRAPERHAYFASQAGQSPFFDPVLRAWIITEPDCCERLLSSPHARPAAYTDDYKRLTERLGIDFSNIVFALSYVPLCLHADAHRSARRRFAEFLAARKSSIATCIPRAVEAQLGILRQEGQVDLVRQVIEPLVLSVTGELAGIDPAAVAGRPSVSSIFDKWIGVRKRRRADADLGQLRQLIASALAPQASEDEVGVRLALFILGRDATIGTLAESLHRLFIEHPGGRLDEIDYPETPPETGVPYVERVVTESFGEGEIRFKPGDRLRIYLQSFAGSGSARERARIFGVGNHSCLGRPLSLDLWREMTSYLAAIPLHADIVSHALRTDDYVFVYPQHLIVRLYA